MILKFEKEIYETIWTGNVDRIISYDTEKMIYLVEDSVTGKQRNHMTRLELKNMSLNKEKNSRQGRNEIKVYLDSFKHKWLYSRG